MAMDLFFQNDISLHTQNPFWANSRGDVEGLCRGTGYVFFFNLFMLAGATENFKMMMCYKLN